MRDGRARARASQLPSSATREDSERAHGDGLVVGDGLLILVVVERGLEDLDLVMRDVGKDLKEAQTVSFSLAVESKSSERGKRTRALKAVISSSVRVSDLAMMGIRLTFWCRRRMNSMSIGLSLRVWDSSVSRPRSSRVNAVDERVTGRLDEVEARVDAGTGREQRQCRPFVSSASSRNGARTGCRQACFG